MPESLALPYRRKPYAGMALANGLRSATSAKIEVLEPGLRTLREFDPASTHRHRIAFCCRDFRHALGHSLRKQRDSVGC
jgi:hypothetical protein